MQRRLNELRSEFLEKRSKVVEWWLTAMAIILTFFSIIAVVVGYISFEEINQAIREAKQARDEVSQEMERVKALVEEIALSRDVAREKLEELNAEIVSTNPSQSARTATSVREDPTTSPIDRAIAAAVLLQRQGKIEEAIEQWRSIATVAGEEDRQLQARAWFSIGYLLSGEERGDLEAKRDAYTKAIKLNPAFAEAYVNRGGTKNRLGQHEEAIADYDRALELTPADDYAYYNRGNAKRRLGQHEEAIADYDRALELNPADADAYNNRGIAKRNLGQHEEAIADYDRALELNPNMVEAYLNRGNAKETLGRLNEARTDYQQALVLAQESGNEPLITAVRRSLGRLDTAEGR